MKENAIVDEFLFCLEMKERTRAKDVFDMHRWCARYDKASIRFCSPDEASCSAYRVSNHCTIHKYALACKTLPLELKSVLDSVAKSVNFILGRAVNSHYSKHFATTLERSISTFFSPPKCNGYCGEKYSPVLQRLPLKLPCFFKSMGQ